MFRFRRKPRKVERPFHNGFLLQTARDTMGMMSKRHSRIAGAAVMSLLLLGLVPVFAQSNEPSQTDKATIIIQVAQAAHSYAEQLVGIAKQHQVNTTKAESLKIGRAHV